MANKTFQREWSWKDKRNFLDTIDADEINEAAHALERELDNIIAGVLAQGSGVLPAPHWDSLDITLTPNEPAVLLRHDLNSTDLLVDLKYKPTGEEKEAWKAKSQFELDTTLEWSTMPYYLVGLGSRQFSNDVVWVLPGPNHIMLCMFPPKMVGGGNGRGGGGEGGYFERIVRARIWKW